MSNRTKGEWKAEGSHVTGRDSEGFLTSSDSVCRVYPEENGRTDSIQAQANARFIAMAGSVAHKLDSLGYDGEALISRLPSIVALVLECEALVRDYPIIHQQVREILSLKP